MAGVTYKCPNCGAYLEFDPESQGLHCPFCDSRFEQSELRHEDAPEADASVHGGQVAYHCPSCGSEIMTDETTVATQCYYCHSPVVLRGKLGSEHCPDGVLPFTIDREKALSTFREWVKGKRYIPRDFFAQAQLEQLSGVYYPHYAVDCELVGVVDGEGRNTSVHTSANYVVTSTKHFHIRREAELRFGGILRPALSKANRKLSDAIHPFPLQDIKPFSDAYLSGFLAERRDVDAAAVEADVKSEVAGYVEPMLTQSIHYNSFQVQPSSHVRRMDCRYVLLPTWVLTYPNRKNPQEPYYYAMNGCTGEVCGKLPIDRRKLGLTALGLAGAVFALGCLLCYFLL